MWIVLVHKSFEFMGTGAREAAIKAMLKGMRSLTEIYECLQTLPLDTLQECVCGAASLDHKAIAAHLHIDHSDFVEAEDGDNRHAQFCQVSQLR